MIKDFRHFFEDKNRLIDNLNLTDEQKEELKAFFKKHPNYESKIDWNNKSLQYKDFEEVLALEGNSENSKKKYGLSGKAQIEDLVEGKDYLIIAEDDQRFYHTTLYYPLTFKASEVLAKPTTPPLGVTGKWCIAGRNYSPGTRDQHWNTYTENGTDFFFLFTMAKEDRYKQVFDTKFAISRSIDNEFFYFDSEDHEVSEEPNDFGYDEDGNWFEDQDSSESDMDPALIWAKETIDELQPDNILAKARFYIDDRGVRFSKDRQVLQRCPDRIKGEYRIPEGTECINPGAFQGTGLSKVEIPAFIKEIPFNAFINSRALSQVLIEDGVERLGSKAFANCNKLKEINLPESIKDIKDAAFTGCMSLTGIKLPSSITELHCFTFAHCFKLQEVILPQGLKSIWGDAFETCIALKRLSLPSSVTFIKIGAFENSGLEELEMYPMTRGGLLSGVFRLTPLKKIIFHGTEEQLRQTMPPFFNQTAKQEAWDYGRPFLPWGCEVHCTEDNKVFKYDKPAVQG